MPLPFVVLPKGPLLWNEYYCGLIYPFISLWIYFSYFDILIYSHLLITWFLTKFGNYVRFTVFISFLNLLKVLLNIKYVAKFQVTNILIFLRIRILNLEIISVHQILITSDADRLTIGHVLLWFKNYVINRKIRASR